MRTPFSMGIMYTFMGIMFTYLAVQSVGQTLFTFSTIVLMLVASFDFMVALKMYVLNAKIIRHNKK